MCICVYIYIYICVLLCFVAFLFYGDSYRIKKYIDQCWGVLLLAWRGYSGNKGIPTEKNLYIDGKAALNWIKSHTGYQNNEIILYGESLGSGVAVELGIKHKFKSIVL